MKLNLLILVIIGLLSYGLTTYLSQNTTLLPNANKEKTNQLVFKFSFTDTKGKSYEITDFKGKTVILNFWASWCAPCIKEFPLLLDAAKNNPDTVLIALSSDLKEDAIGTFITKMEKTQNLDFSGKNTLIAWDENQKISDQFGIFKLPETLIITPDQTISHKFIGAEWTAKNLQQAIENTKK